MTTKDVVTMNGIGWAVKQLTAGAKVRRVGWNGLGMFLMLIDGSTFNCRPTTAGSRSMTAHFGEGTEVRYRPHVDMYTAQGDVVPWVCSQSDLLAVDWVIAE